MAHTETMMRTQQRREAIAKDQASGYNLKSAPPNDRSMSIVRYAEGWIRCDTDNDGVAELIHVHMLGNAHTLVQWERTDETPLACFTPYREPGRIIGSSQADMVMDLQRIESRVMRAVLDSLGQSRCSRGLPWWFWAGQHAGCAADGNRINHPRRPGGCGDRS